MSDKYLPVTEDKKKALSAQLGDVLPPGYKDLSICQVLKGSPAFYPNWTCYEIQKEEDVTAKPLCVFVKNKEVVPLDWQAATLLKFNKEAPLVLSIHDITHYVRFFFSHVRVRDGSMKIVTTYDDLKWREEPANQVKKALAALIRPPHLISWDEETHSYEVGAHILFHNNLFECRLHVNRLGEIDVSERTMQVEDMPLIDPSVE